ncbi:hypothetical protein CSA37_00120 [Candidatus Fermentibacteria bacterium]|nr:MAG: hypothetical protein CSA37_00120 [Candidatus Fermentibacteria bacterium]
MLALLLASLAADRKKTLKALKIAWKKFSAILPQFAVMLVLVSISLYLIPEHVIQENLEGEENTVRGLLIALMAGSLAFMPGFIAFPLCGILRSKGVPFLIISGFSTTLMMVGIFSFPVERKLLGTGAAITRNAVSFLVAVAVALVTGLVFGEVTL